MSRWEKLWKRKLLFGSIPFQTILIQGQIYPGMKIIFWYIGFSGIKNNATVTYSYLLVSQIGQSSVQIPDWYQKSTIQDQQWFFSFWFLHPHIQTVNKEWHKAPLQQLRRNFSYDLSCTTVTPAGQIWTFGLRHHRKNRMHKTTSALMHALC